MRLRPRQKLFVERSLAALSSHGNTLGIASTGFGKSIALSAVVSGSIDGTDARACVLAHRDELTTQNRSKFARVAPDLTTSVIDASSKDWTGQATFAMVPTLARPANLAEMPKLALLVIDETHVLEPDDERLITHRKRSYFDLVRGTLEQLRKEGKLRDVDLTVATFSLLGMVMWISKWYRADGRLGHEAVAWEITELALAAVLRDDRRDIPAFVR